MALHMWRQLQLEHTVTRHANNFKRPRVQVAKLLGALIRDHVLCRDINLIPNTKCGGSIPLCIIVPLLSPLGILQLHTNIFPTVQQPLNSPWRIPLIANRGIGHRGVHSIIGIKRGHAE